MIRMLLSAGLLAISAFSSAAFAQAIEEKDLLSGKAAIEADDGYIFISGPVRQMGRLLRVPDAQSTAEYEKDWAEAFAKARDKYPREMQRWELGVRMAKRNRNKVPERPIEPTRENFSIGPIELRGAVDFGPMFVFAKTEDPDSYSYLIRVTPGRYMYYGSIGVDANGNMTGVCLCMGSIAFDVKPGMITDVGNFLMAAAGPDPDFPDTGPESDGAGLYRPAQTTGQWGEVRFGLADSLKSYPHETADFHAYGKIDNYYGIIVSRMPPIPGVLAYDRDRAVDLKTEGATPTAEPVTAIAAGPDADPVEGTPPGDE